MKELIVRCQLLLDHCCFYTPLKQKISSFMMFSGGIEIDHWPKMGQHFKRRIFRSESSNYNFLDGHAVFKIFPLNSENVFNLIFSFF